MILARPLPRAMLLLAVTFSATLAVFLHVTFAATMNLDFTSCHVNLR
jgi:hypothetical protein